MTAQVAPSPDWRAVQRELASRYAGPDPTPLAWRAMPAVVAAADGQQFLGEGERLDPAPRPAAGMMPHVRVSAAKAPSSP